jgi:hypothetical protein
MGGFPDASVVAYQLYGPSFAFTPRNVDRWRQLATALNYSGTIVVDYEPASKSEAMEATA